MAAPDEKPKQNPVWFLDAKCPVFLPKLEALSLPSDQFKAHMAELLKSNQAESEMPAVGANTGDDESFTVISEQPSATVDAQEKLQELTMGPDPDDAYGANTPEGDPFNEAFMEGLKSYPEVAKRVPEFRLGNKMLTDNGDVSFQSTKNTLVDLFTELEELISGPRLRELLNAAWQEDPLMTLKIIFNARSIHLGKASRLTFYRCAGWLAQHHPRTLVANLRWLSRPVIPKRVEKREEGDNDVVVVQLGVEADPNGAARFDVKNGVAHGYWKDLLNILALSADGQLTELANPRQVFNLGREGKRQPVPSQDEAREKRHNLRTNRHETVIQALQDNPVHRAIHLTVARLFAEQLAADIAVLRGDDKAAERRISLCAKWAPSTDRFHDKHTFLTSSIAEMVYPEAYFVSKGILSPTTTDVDRTVYLRYARDELRKDVTQLRKSLNVVERDLTTGAFDRIKYERVPSIAMSNYSKIFAEKDAERFESYLDKVAGGESQISGATLLPSTLISAVRTGSAGFRGAHIRKKRMHAALQQRIFVLSGRVVGGQWKTLVQRIKDSGTLESCIAVVDVSASMGGPVFPDGTVPIDTAIGMGLLIAQVTKPPFGGGFIAFSATPTVQTIDTTATLSEMYASFMRCHWGLETNFEAVFLDLTLPMAVSKKLTQEHMVKRIFVFSDMQFNQANAHNQDAWSTSYERIQKAFSEAGYEVPEMVFWNLAGGRGGSITPKPITTDVAGVALVSGYSQGLLKVFLDNGRFEGEQDEEVVETNDETGEDGELVRVEKTVKKAKLDPLITVKKAVSHPAYSILEVVD